MPRINIEDSIHADQGYQQLVEKFGRFQAIGMLYFAWREAQKFWVKGRLAIPLETWKSRGLVPELIDFGLAEITTGGVYMKGSEQQFSWLDQRSDAGKRSGEVRKLKSNIKDKSPTVVERSLNGRQREGNGSEPLTLTLSQSLTLKEKEEGKSKAVEPSAATPPKANLIISVYCEAYKKRYGANPTITRKDSGQLANLLKSVGQDRLSQMLQVYLQMDDPWFKTRTHDVSTFIGSLSKIGVALQTGKAPGEKKIDWSKFEE